MSKLMMLVAAKWREFSNINPNLQTDNNESAAAAVPEADYPKPGRPRAVKEKPESEAFDDEDDDDDDDDSKIKKKRSGRGKKSSKKASKVPTLKIKLGKRKRGSSVSFL